LTGAPARVKTLSPMATSKKPPTLKALRELARKHLGNEHGALKTREELVKALRRWLPSPLQAVKAAAKKAVAKKAAPKKPPARRAPARKAPAQPAQKEEPVVEGFFVARVVDEGEARRHHLTERRPGLAPEPPAAAPDERLGELPAGYGDDAAVLLPLDPHTLFVFWDFREETCRRAAAGLEQPRAVLRVFEGEQQVREVDFALESRSFYVHGLPPGRRYRVEAHFVGRDGRSQRIGTATAAIELPREGPSADGSVRFLRIPWGVRVSQLEEALRRGVAAIRSGAGDPRVDAWSRVLLPSSAPGGASELAARR
jgi:hypothetical protein